MLRKAGFLALLFGAGMYSDTAFSLLKAIMPDAEFGFSPNIDRISAVTGWGALSTGVLAAISGFVTTVAWCHGRDLKRNGAVVSHGEAGPARAIPVMTAISGGLAAAFLTCVSTFVMCPTGVPAVESVKAETAPVVEAPKVEPASGEIKITQAQAEQFFKAFLSKAAN